MMGNNGSARTCGTCAHCADRHGTAWRVLGGVCLVHAVGVDKAASGGISPCGFERPGWESAAAEELEDLDLSVRTYNCLKRCGIHKTSQLRAFTPSELMSIRNMSERCVEEVREALYRFGMRLAGDTDPVPNDPRAKLRPKDFAEVVRCRDCRSADMEEGSLRCRELKRGVPENGYCHLGERRGAE